MCENMYMYSRVVVSSYVPYRYSHPTDLMTIRFNAASPLGISLFHVVPIIIVVVVFEKSSSSVLFIWGRNSEGNLFVR